MERTKKRKEYMEKYRHKKSNINERKIKIKWNSKLEKYVLIIHTIL
jgi:hypothetical protein